MLAPGALPRQIVNFDIIIYVEQTNYAKYVTFFQFLLECLYVKLRHHASATFWHCQRCKTCKQSARDINASIFLRNTNNRGSS